MERLEMSALQAHALRAYERSRLRAALRVLVVILPVVMLSALLGTSLDVCVCSATVIVPTAVMLRWYGQGFGNAATNGVLVGGTAATGLLLACRFALLDRVSPTALVSSCACCGLVAGAALAYGVHRENLERVGARALVAAGVASAMMSLGCAEAGVSTVIAFGLSALFAAGVGTLVRKG